MKTHKLITGALAISLLVGSTLLAQDRRKSAQSGLQFLSVATDARAAAMGSAVHTLSDMQSASLFFNPATMANMTARVEITASQNKWIADINHNAVTAAIRPCNGKYGVVGLSFLAVDYGEIQGTIVDPGAYLGYSKTDVISPTAMAAGIGYANKITSQFQVGGQIKYARQTLGHSSYQVSDTSSTRVKNEVGSLIYDFGTLFHTGYHSLVFGMSVRNFAPELKYEREGFQPPMAFTLAISMDLLDLFPVSKERHSLQTVISHSYFRSHPGQVVFAVDYCFMKMLSLRCGYIIGNDEDDISFGMGFNAKGLTLDYAYTPFGVFDKVQRMTARFSI